MNLEWNATGDYPQLAPTAYAHPTAVLIGNVRVGQKVYVGPNAVIRADEPGEDGMVKPIVIGDESNIQDGVIIHALGGTRVNIGRGSSVAHGAVVHGPCEIGANCFVGFNSVVYGASLGNGVVVMHQALVEGVVIPEGLYVPSLTAVRCQADVSRLMEVPPDVRDLVDKVRRTNIYLAETQR